MRFDLPNVARPREGTEKEILRSLPLRYAQGFGSPLRMTESEGARIDTSPAK